MKHLFTILLGILIFIGVDLLGLEDLKSKVIFIALMILNHAFGFMDGIKEEE